MSSGPKSILINCAGGLNLVGTTAELFEAPGYATKLLNFESSNQGGYRRINGYTKGASETQPSGTSNAILGVVSYADGIVAVQYDNTNYSIFFSTDRITWYQINIDMSTPGYATGMDLATLQAGTPTTRSVAGRAQFVLFEGNTDYGELVICDGANNVAIFKIEGTGGSRTYHYTEITTVGNMAWCEVYKDRVVVGGNTVNPSDVYWSNTNAPADFTGANAGSLTMPSKVNGIKVWRNRLFVFGSRSIDEISGIVSATTGSPAVENISRNLGCINGFSIQEVGGDIVFLSADGFRNLGGTDKIDDIGLGAISKLIFPLVQEVLNNLTTLDISSMVIRERDQYRLFFTKSSNPINRQRGIVGTVKASPDGIRWEWSEISGIPLSCGFSGLVDGAERVYHGGYDGYIYNHDTGSSFNGSDIIAQYQTPEINYGSLMVVDTLHWMKLSMRVDGSLSNMKLKTSFNFGDNTNTIQPEDIILINRDAASIYGTAIYGTATYSGNNNLEVRSNLIGSGFSNKFLFYTIGMQDPYSIDSFFIKYHEGSVQ